MIFWVFDRATQVVSSKHTTTKRSKNLNLKGAPNGHYTPTLSYISPNSDTGKVVYLDTATYSKQLEEQRCGSTPTLSREALELVFPIARASNFPASDVS